MAPASTVRFPARLARAKVNYALHVTGMREDGYHLIDSLAAFPDIGDRIGFGRDETSPGLDITGRFAGDLGDAAQKPGKNLVWVAAMRLADALGRRDADVALELKKMLPVASGIGGGSADAAATLGLLRDLWQPDFPDTELAEIALEIGADVPMCLGSRAVRVRGIGEELTALAAFPEHAILLANAGVAVSTPDIFKSLTKKTNAALPGRPETGFETRAALWSWLQRTRNDLETPALQRAPQIEETLEALRGVAGNRCVRMSGSGATCFALFDDLETARAGETVLRETHVNWWIAAAPVRGVASP